jgi:2-polyprenyl-3-methyl-5-hydroxy-6-metoxy-1,4-benzoquinol methylase
LSQSSIFRIDANGRLDWCRRQFARGRRWWRRAFHRGSLGPAHFSQLYDAKEDPWGFRTSTYEQAKYRTAIEALADRHFQAAFEVGCSIGEMTRLLAPRCDAVLAVDLVEQPLVAARAACADQPWVNFLRMQVPGDWPDGAFDLIVLSEVLYFLSPADIAAVADRCAGSLAPGGVVLLVNWRGRSDDPCTGEEAAALFIKRTRGWLQPRTHLGNAGYRLDLLVRP